MVHRSCLTVISLEKGVELPSSPDRFLVEMRWEMNYFFSFYNQNPRLHFPDLP